MRLIAIAAGLLCVATAKGQADEELPRYETVFYPSGKLKMEAYLYKPDRPGPFPVVIYNHGSRMQSEREERPFAYVGLMLRAAGYLVVVPERRGYGKSDGSRLGKRWERTAVRDSWRACRKRRTTCWRRWSL
jgi:dipeptidyl aminopeptidase/acylaminoacyl peptidase